ncbi:MAG: phosphate ABC transporter substrate-binding protein [Thaumarchaeota archaeon]|nr:MAG: phosphate ABC transporter substrate-binding protein [Nitrososphaerota archaeon]
MRGGIVSNRGLLAALVAVAVAMFFVGYLISALASSNISREGVKTMTTTIVKAAGLNTRLNVAGSTTVTPIVEEAARRFSELYPGFRISVAAIGSGPGIKAVGGGEVDIGMASRDLKEEEFKRWPDLKPFKIAMDSIAIIVHPSNPVNELTLEQVAKIFAGEIRNWREVGGPDKPIHVITREKGSGTRDCFEHAVMKPFGKEVSADAMVQQGNPKVRAAVANDPLSIGYISLGFVDETVKPLKIDGVEPRIENVLKGTYPIKRNLYVVTKGDPDPAELMFIGYLLSAEGQKIVAELGYISLYPVS